MGRAARNGCWIVLVLFALAFVATIPRTIQGSARLKYSEFLTKIETGEIASVMIENRRAHGEFTAPPIDNTGGPAEFYVELPQNDAEIGNLLDLLRSTNRRAHAAGHGGIVFDTPAPFISDGFQQVLFSVFLPLGAIMLLWVLFWRQAKSVSRAALTPQVVGVNVPSRRRRRRLVIRRAPREKR